MNRTIRNLVIAVPLATVGLTMVNTAAATAGPNGPIILGQPEKPKDKAPKPQPKAPKPVAQPQNQVVAAPQAAKVEKKAAKVVVETVSAHGSADSIDRADTLFVAAPAETKLAANTTDDGGMDLTWLLIGGGLVTASGAAFAARKRNNA